MATDRQAQDRTTKQPKDGDGSSPRVRRAEMFTNLGLELTSADDLRTIAANVRNFCDHLWDWDVFHFTVRRSKSSYQFRSVLAIDTIDGEKCECDEKNYNQSDYSAAWTRLLEGEPILVNRNVSQAITDSPGGEQLSQPASLIFAPIRIRGSVTGVISLQSYTPGKFETADRDLLMKAADYVGPTLLRCRAEQTMQEFLRLGERLNKVVDTAGVARVVANTAASLLGWDFMSVHLYEAAKSNLRLVLGMRRSATNCEVLQPTSFNTPSVEGMLAEALNGAGLHLDFDSLSATDVEILKSLGDRLPLSSIILCPVRSLNRVVGLLCIQSESSTAYGTEELEIARALSDYCGGALERAWTEQDLKQSEANYRLLVENVNDGIVISQNDRFAFFNSRFASMLGYTSEELKLKTYADIYSEAGLEILLSRTRKRNAGEIVPDRYETEFQKKNGELLPVEANVRIISDFNGANATFAVIRNISERKEAERKLRQSDEELRTLFNAMTDIILVIDINGRYLKHGSGDNQLLFTPWENLAGKTLHEILTPEKADYFLQVIRRSLESREILNIEYDHDSATGDRNWYNATISPLSDHAVLMVARNVTERRQAEEELFRSNARYKALLDGSEDYIFVLDREMRFVHVNSAIEKRYGATASDRMGKTLWSVYDGGPVPPYISLIQSVFETGKPVTYDDDAVVNGRLICTETVISPVFARTGEVEAVLGVSRDVTARRQSEMALKQSEQRYAMAVRGANDGIWDWNLQTDTLYLSPRWWAIVGHPEETQSSECAPEVWLQRIHFADLLSFREKIMDHINNDTSHLEDEHRIVHADGSYRWVLCRGICVRDSSGKAVQMAGSLSDITDRKVAEEKLHYNATHDVLTNLPNRGCFLDFLEKAMARAHRLDPSQHHFAVLFLDLDRFKVINDSLGHMAGDELIVTMARRLEACVRPGDTVARMGGDEFTILLEGLNHKSDATRVADRAIRELSAPIVISGVSVQTTISVGIAYDKPEYSNPNDLLRDADTAMYRAKAAGRNRYQVFDQQMHALAMEQLHWEADLRKAVARQEFVMHYQPVYNLQTGLLSGFEALLRWNHPENGLIYPGEFIPLAEETGLIIPIGMWVIDEAARAVAEWNVNRPEDSPLTISINLSPRQIAQPGIAPRICFLITNAGAQPKHVIVEITENILMDNSQLVADTLQGLRQAGIQLDLDDFGTGYSSLSYLRRYPLDMLKIDRSFISDLTSSESSRQIVCAMLNLARGLGLRVTAEGVETREQYQALVDMECDWGQGYFFHKPVTFDKTFEIIEQHSNINLERTV